MLVKITHDQFDADFPPPEIEPIVNVVSEEPWDIQIELCERLGTKYGLPVDYVDWEPYEIEEDEL